MKKKNVGPADLPPKSNSVVLNVEGKIFALSGSLEQINGLVNAWCTVGDPVRLDHWLKRDTWTSEEAFLLLNGLDPTGTKIGKHANIYDFVEDTYIDEFKHLAILDGRSMELQIFNAVCAALVEAGVRREDDEQIFCFKATCCKALDRIKEMQEIFLSGNHPERNPPAFYLAWAEKKGFNSNTVEALRQKLEIGHEQSLHPGANSKADKQSLGGQSEDESSVKAESSGAPDTPRKIRAKHDMTAERGCRELILRNWETVEKLHGDKATARQVLRILGRNLGSFETAPLLHTVENKLWELRKENLIP